MGLPTFSSAPVSAAGIARYPNPAGNTGFDERVLPTLKRYGSATPVFAASVVSGGSGVNLGQNPSGSALTPTTTASYNGTIYWPYVVNIAATSIVSPINNFYMYYSCDHASTGGIWFASAPTPYGPWTGQGQLFSSGNQMENASVIWNDDTGLLHMYYKQQYAAGSYGSLSSELATSPDGITWTQQGLILQNYTNGNFPGNNEVCYARPFRIGRQWYMHLLLDGKSQPHFGLATSTDGISWIIDPRTLGYGDDQFTDGRRIEWNSGDVVTWKGRLWWVGMCSNFTSGSTAKDARIGIAPLANDLRHLIGTPQYQLYPTVGAWESTNYRALQSYVYQGKIIVTYQCTPTSGVYNGIGTFNIATT